MMKKIIPFLVLLALFSCDKQVAYNKVFNDFTANHWIKNDIKVFDFTLDETIEAGTISILFSHISESQFPMIPLEVYIERPSGEEEKVYVNMRFKDAKGKSLSDCAGDVCDLTTTIKEGTKFEKGHYKITLQNKFTYDFIPNVLALGLSIRADKK